MEARATEVLGALRNTNLSIESKSATLAKLKSEIKQKNVPESAIPAVFDAVRLAIASQHSTISTTGFSALGHLLKRLYLQEQLHAVAYQGRHTYPMLLERMGDHKERVRAQASQAFADFWPASPQEVEQQVLESALCGKNPRAKETAVLWLAMMAKDHGLLFRTYVPRLVACLEDGDSGVREAAKSTVIELFQNVPSKALSDLKKQLQLHNVRKSIVSSIMSGLGAPTGPNPDASFQSRAESVRPPSSFSSRREDGHRPPSALSTRSISNGDGPPALARNESSFQSQTLSVKTEPPRLNHSASTESFPALTPDTADSEAVEPLYVNSQRELDEIFREMTPHFEGKESEQNWSLREKSILKLRRVTKGNAPHDYQTHFLANFKALLDGILKAVASLRTTLSAAGCNLLQDIARTCGPNIDPMVEILLLQLVKHCGSLKKIAAHNGNVTVDVLIGNVSYTSRIMQHIWGACQDKNVQPRLFATGWLKTILAKHGKHRGVIEHGGGVELLEKCIKKGLSDANPGVRESMRGTYWMFARFWPDRAEAIMATLDAKSKTLLERDPGNPNRDPSAQSAPAARSKQAPMTPSRSTLKEAISAQKKARLAASRNMPPRPESAQSAFTDVKATTTGGHRQGGTTTTSSVRSVPTGVKLSSSQSASLSSAPMRPSSRPRRPELARPATADPYSTRRSVYGGGAQSKASSPSTSPHKPRTKSVVIHGSKAATPARPKSRLGDAPRSTARTKPTKSEDTLPLQSSNKGHRSMIDLGRDDPDTLPMDTRPPTTPMKPAQRHEVDAPPVTAPHVTEAHPSVGRQHQTRRSLDGASHLPQPVFPTGSPRGTSDAIVSHIPLSPSYRASHNTDTTHTSITSPNRRHSRNTSDQSATHIPVPAKRLSFGQAEVQVQDIIQVYEDPESPLESKGGTVADQVPQPSPKTPAPGVKATPLEELPLNEPTTVPNRKHHQFPQSTELVHSTSPIAPASEKPHRRWKKVEGSERKRSLSPRSKDPVRARDMIDRGLNKIRAGAIDVHGYRKFQSLLRYHESIVKDEAKYEQVLLALLEALESPDGDRPLGRSLDLKTQVLVTIRMLRCLNAPLFAKYYARTMTAIITARKHYDGTNHIVSGLEETSEDIVATCDPPEVIDATLDLIENGGNTPEAYRMVAMGTYILSGLLHRLNEKNLFLADPELKRLGDFARQNLRNPQPDVRRAVIEFSLELYDMVKPEEVFWSMIDSPTEDVRPLLTYYIMRKQTQTRA